MTSTWTPIKSRKTNMSLSENIKKRIENHIKTADHLETASKYHLEAADFCKAGNYEKATQCTNAAQAYISLAYEAQNEY